MARFVITGGLGVGKTSVLALLEPRYDVVAEPARELIAEHRSTGSETALDRQPELFVELLVARSIDKFTAASPSAVTIFDRGVPDCIAYAMAYELDIGPALDAASQCRYEAPVFIASPWLDIYGTDDMRRASFAQAEAFHSYVVDAYERLGYQTVELPKTSVKERAAFISDHIEARSTSNTDWRIEIRELGADRIELIREIDRSELIDVLYTVEDGRLRSERVNSMVPPWDSKGHGDHSSARRITEFRPIVEKGATLLGAFVDGLFAGIAIVDPDFEEQTAWFAFLHVSRAYRRRGVASALWTAGVDVAAAADATSMHVSATPSGSAVGFYTSRGCRLAEAPHPALFAKEPEDVHLICPLPRRSGTTAVRT